MSSAKHIVHDLERRFVLKKHKRKKKRLSPEEREQLKGEVRRKVLRARPMHAISYVEAFATAERHGLRIPRRVRRHPMIRANRDLDVTVFGRYYPPSIDLMPEAYRSFTRDRLDHYAEAMALPYAVETMDFMPDRRGSSRPRRRGCVWSLPWPC